MSGAEILAIFGELDDIRKTIGGKKTKLGKDGKITTDDRDDIEKLGEEIKKLKDELHDLSKRIDVIGIDAASTETAKLLTEELKETNNELQQTLFDLDKRP